MTVSRVEAVARAIECEVKSIMGPRGFDPEDLVNIAQDAIEASDAWLVEQVAAEADKQIADRHEPEDTDR